MADIEFTQYGIVQVVFQYTNSPMHMAITCLSLGCSVISTLKNSKVQASKGINGVYTVWHSSTCFSVHKFPNAHGYYMSEPWV